MESQQPGRPAPSTTGVQTASQTGQARSNAVAKRPTNVITPNRGGLNPRGTLASLRKKLFRSY